MPRRGDNIRKRKDGRWEARYPKGRREDGTRKYASVYAATYREVKEKRQLFLLAEQEQQKQASTLLMRDALQMWQQSNRIRLKGASVSRYQYLIDTHINPELGNIPLAELSVSTVNAFLSRKLDSGRLDGKGGLSSTYVRSIMLVIHAAITYASRVSLCEPLHAEISKPPLSRKEMAIFSREHQRILENSLLSDTNETKLGVYISLYTGLRIGEVCALAWEDVDLENRMLHVRHTVVRVLHEEETNNSSLRLDLPKTPSSLRSIPICSKLHTLLTQYACRGMRGYVLTASETFLNPRTYEYRYSKLLNACNIPYLNYHALRHTFATRCVEAGMDVKMLSEILGHSNAAITLNTYVHASLDMKRVQLEKLSC